MNKTEAELTKEEIDKIRNNDIDKIRNNAIIIASEFDKKVAVKRISRDKGIGYITIKNGYMVSMIVDATKDKLRYFLSTINPTGITDSEVSEVIARDIIGEGYKILKKDNFVDFTKEDIIDQGKITQEDIKKARENLAILREDNVLSMMLGGGIRPITLSNWYKVSFSIDVVKENMRMVHLSISNPIGKTDNKIAEKMAREIIGEDVQTIGSMFHSNVIHFMKVETPSTMVELFSNMGDKNEKNNKYIQKEGENKIGRQTEGENKIGRQTEGAKGENLKAVNEGELNDGIEGRVKKKI